MPWTETELDSEFRQWIIDFPNEALPLTYQLLGKFPQKNVVIFKSREQADEYLIKAKTPQRL